MPNNLKALNTFSETFYEGVIHGNVLSCLFTAQNPVEIVAVNGFRENSPTNVCERMLKSLRAQSGLLEIKATLNTAQPSQNDNMTSPDAQLYWKNFPEEAVRETKEQGAENGEMSWTDVRDINSLLRIQSNSPLAKPYVDLRNRLNAKNGIFEMQNITVVHCDPSDMVTGTEWRGIQNASAAKTMSPQKDKQPQFEQLFSTGHRGEELSEFDDPVGVAFNPDGDIVIADYNNDRLQVLSSEGNFIRAHNHYSRESGKQFPFISPAGVACDASGNITVVEKGRNRVVVLSPTGTILHAFGRHGKEPGQFRGPHGVSIDARSRIVVTDTMNCRVQVFDHEGNFLFMFGDKGPGKLNYPCYAIFHEGRFYVADTDNDCVKVFDTRGTFVRTFGHDFSAPSGIAIYKNKYLLVCDYSSDCVKVCSLEGRLLSKFSGISGEGKGQFLGPEAVAVTPEGRIAVSDKLNCRIQILDLVI